VLFKLTAVYEKFYDLPSCEGWPYQVQVNSVVFGKKLLCRLVGKLGENLAGKYNAPHGAETQKKAII
jgi:hypothetical protein